MNKIPFILQIPLFLLMMTSCVNEREPGDVYVYPGDRLPEFSVTLYDGKVVTTETLNGKVGVIEFFNTSCGDCRKSFPTLQMIYEEFKDNPEVEIAAIARAETEESILAYWEENSLSIPWAPQSDRSVFSLFAASGIPRLFISDKSGVVRFAFDENSFPETSALAENINSLL